MSPVRKFAILAGTYLAMLAVGFLLFILLIRSPAFSSLSILFYRGVLLAALAAALLAILGVFAFWKWRISDLQAIVGGVALSLSFNLCFLVLFPVTFDRSVTMFLLARIEQRDGQLDEAALNRIFLKEYVGDMRQIHRRVEEQALSGNILVEAGRIRLTPRGRQLMSTSRAVGRWFGADPRFVDPESSLPH